jgi:hypothetical protein
MFHSITIDDIHHMDKKKESHACQSDVNDHSHRPGCGHTAIVYHYLLLVYPKITYLMHEGHTDFLIPNSNGVIQLHHLHRGVPIEHTLRETNEFPAVCAPVSCKGHASGHTHGPSCGHQAIQHSTHVDYLVDNYLHHFHGSHCDNHGALHVLNLDDKPTEDWEELLHCLGDNCPDDCFSSMNSTAVPAQK